MLYSSDGSFNYNALKNEYLTINVEMEAEFSIISLLEHSIKKIEKLIVRHADSGKI